MYRNIMIMLTGSLAAQVITIILSPVITRLYGPEIMGSFSYFSSIINILMPISALCFPYAIPMRNLKEIENINKLSLIASVLIASLSLLIILIFWSKFNLTFNKWCLLLIPLSILFSTQVQLARQNEIRDGDFKKLSKIAFRNSLFVNFSKVTIGILYPTEITLILIAVVAPLVEYLQFNKSIKIKEKLNIFILKKTLVSNLDFAVYRTPQILINGISQGMPVLFITQTYGAKFAGLFALANTMLLLPVTIVSKSVGDVFYPNFSKEYKKNKKNASNLIIKMSAFLLLISIIPVVFILGLGEEVFSFVFGEEWKNSGIFAMYLVFSCSFMLASRPAISAIPVLKLQRSFLIFEIINIPVKFLALYWPYHIGFDLFESIKFYVVVNCLFYFLLMLTSIKVTFTRAKNEY